MLLSDNVINMKFLNAGCGTHYADGWINVDIWEDDSTKPDVLAKVGEPYPFENNYFDAVFLGHVLEHMDWKMVPEFLYDMQRIAKPDALFLIVGPDILKTIHRWKDGNEPWEMVLSTIEHQDVNYQPGKTDWWDGAAHHWNCHHERVWKLLESCGFTNLRDMFDIIPNNPHMKKWSDKNNGITWPVVGKWHWQFAIQATN